MDDSITVKQEAVDAALKYYENELYSSKYYGDTPEGRAHQIRSSSFRWMGLQLGIFTDELIAGAVKRVETKLKKSTAK